MAGPGRAEGVGSRAAGPRREGDSASPAGRERPVFVFTGQRVNNTASNNRSGRGVSDNVSELSNNEHCVHLGGQHAAGGV